MTLKELIYAEVNKIEEDNLDELYQFVKQRDRQNRSQTQNRHLKQTQTHQNSSTS